MLLFQQGIKILAIPVKSLNCFISYTSFIVCRAMILTNDSHFVVDELIRQVTINCAERGLLLLRVRDEIRMTIAAYQTLYESSVAFGMRKALQAEQGKADMERKVKPKSIISLTARKLLTKPYFCSIIYIYYELILLALTYGWKLIIIKIIKIENC